MRSAILITPEEVRVGDIIRFSSPDSVLVNKYHVTTLQVNNILGTGWNWIAVGDDEHRNVVVVHLRRFSSEYPLELVRRLRQKGKAEADSLEAVEAAMRRCAHAQIENDGRSVGAYLELWRTTDLDEALHALREAIEAYELGSDLSTMPISCPPYTLRHRVR